VKFRIYFSGGIDSFLRINGSGAVRDHLFHRTTNLHESCCDRQAGLRSFASHKGDEGESLHTPQGEARRLPASGFFLLECTRETRSDNENRQIHLQTDFSDNQKNTETVVDKDDTRSTRPRLNVVCANCRGLARLKGIEAFPFTKGIVQATYRCLTCGMDMTCPVGAADARPRLSVAQPGAKAEVDH
jgi:hypothetical protein